MQALTNPRVSAHDLVPPTALLIGDDLPDLELRLRLVGEVQYHVFTKEDDPESHSLLSSVWLVTSDGFLLDRERLYYIYIFLSIVKKTAH